MNLITAFDNWMFDKTVIALDWLSDWFSISQGRVEQLLIGAFAVSCVAELIGRVLHPFGAPIWLIVVLMVGMVVFMWLRHKMPTSVRVAFRIRDRGLRIMWVVLTVAFLLPPYMGKFYDIGIVFEQVSLVLFMYVIASNSDGQKGRKRKMAWAKLKGMFSWLPAPQPEGV